MEKWVSVLFVVIIVLIILMVIYNPTIRNELYYLYNKRDPIVAIASFRGGKDSPGIDGTVVFKEDKNLTIIDVDLEGVPDGLHGFHIHKAGDLSKGCQSACDHFNPTNVDHGDINNGHVGDMGNVISSDKKIKMTLYSDKIKLSGPNSIIGRSVVIHENPDDLGLGNHQESLTTGNSGPRIGCAVIGYKAC